MAGEDDLKEALARIAALEKKTAEQDQSKNDNEFLSQLKLIDDVVTGLQKQMAAPDKAMSKDIDDLKGRVKDFEAKMAKLGKK